MEQGGLCFDIWNVPLNVDGDLLDQLADQKQLNHKKDTHC